MTPRRGYGVTVMPAAQDTIVRAAISALPRETGGILLGWRGGGRTEGCTVTRAVEVPDARSGRCTYERSHAAAEAALQQALGSLADPDLGYIGEWHSHTKIQPPSPQDRSSIRGAARHSDDTLVLVVPSLLRQDPPAWAWHALAARRRTRLPAVLVRPAELLLEDL